MGHKLNLGRGKDIRPGWINIDSENLAGVDIVGDICNPDTFESLKNNSVSFIELFHILKHIRHPPPLMEALHRIAENWDPEMFRIISPKDFNLAVQPNSHA